MDITRGREDMNFFFRVVKTIFYEQAQRVKYCFSSHRVIFFLLYRQEYLPFFFSPPAQTLSRTAVVRQQEFLEVLSFRLHLY